jgi:hypothetical protein
MTLKTRLARLEARVRPRSLAELPYSELWLCLLECVAQLYFAHGPAKVARRLRDGIAFLYEYRARRQFGINVERVCEEWFMSFDDETGRGAFMDTDIAGVLRQRDQLDRDKLGSASQRETVEEGSS